MNSRFICLFFAIVSTSVVACADDQDDTAAGKVSTAAELVEVLRGAVAAAEPTSLFELVGRNETIVEYDWGIDSSEIVDFRLQLDRKSEWMRWVMKFKKEMFSYAESEKPAEKTPGVVSYVGVSIQGGNLTRFSAAASHPQLAQFDSFDKALASVQIPSPQFFGVVSYELLQNGAQELMQLEPTIMDPQTTVQAKASADSIRYVARTRKGDSQFLVYTWDLRLPDYVPLTFDLDQGLNGQLTRIRSQRLYWEKSPSGIDRPFRIAAENPAVKRKSGGGYHLGRKSIDVELVWLEPEQINKMSLAEFTDIQKYLDIGEAIAKRKESDPSE